MALLCYTSHFRCRTSLCHLHCPRHRLCCCHHFNSTTDCEFVSCMRNKWVGVGVHCGIVPWWCDMLFVWIIVGFSVFLLSIMLDLRLMLIKWHRKVSQEIQNAVTTFATLISRLSQFTLPYLVHTKRLYGLRSSSWKYFEQKVESHLGPKR